MLWAFLILPAAFFCVLVMMLLLAATTLTPTITILEQQHAGGGNLLGGRGGVEGGGGGMPSQGSADGLAAGACLYVATYKTFYHHNLISQLLHILSSQFIE